MTTSASAGVPRVSLIVELEANPRIVVDAANEEDQKALVAWIHECRPDVDAFLDKIAGEVVTDTTFKGLYRFVFRHEDWCVVVADGDAA